jgi:hypothetical protein
MRSLRHWPRRTRPSSGHLPRNSPGGHHGASRTHNDIARLVQTMYAEDFVCSTGATARSSSSKPPVEKLEHGHAESV